MQSETSPNELNERLSLIQSMIAEGRRSTESWGWSFLLWGIAYCVATAWSALGVAEDKAVQPAGGIVDPPNPNGSTSMSGFCSARAARYLT